MNDDRHSSHATKLPRPEVLSLVKRFVRGSLWRLGWDLKRFDPDTSEWARLVRQLAVHQVNVVFDVGANAGQFALSLRAAGFQGRIISFEALASAHSNLQQHAQRDVNWIVPSRAAIGDRDGKTTINISGNSVSSSILPMLAAHVDAEPKSRYVTCEEVDIHRLDTIAGEFTSDGDRVFLKIDVQGYEYQVLKGATLLLDRAAGVQLEMSLVPLYDGEHLFDFMLHELKGRGFELWSLVPGFVNHVTGRLLQVDGVFFRSLTSSVS